MNTAQHENDDDAPATTIGEEGEVKIDVPETKTDQKDAIEDDTKWPSSKDAYEKQLKKRRKESAYRIRVCVYRVFYLFLTLIIFSSDASPVYQILFAFYIFYSYVTSTGR